MDYLRSNSLVGQPVTISLSDRWHVYQRLQDLEIPCSCPSDGSLRVEINTPTAALQLWSVTFQLNASRQRHVAWLKRCWQPS
jgi:hypothetical protein